MRKLTSHTEQLLGWLLVCSLLISGCVPTAQGATLRTPTEQQATDGDASDNVYLPQVSLKSDPNAPTPTPAPPTPTPVPPPTFQLNTIGNRIAPLGRTLSFTLSVSNSNGLALTFSVAPLPLPANATFDPASGQFSFQPQVSQVGEFSLTFTVSNGTESDSKTIKINVPQPSTNGPTILSGHIFDANEAAAGRKVPLVGATVRLMNSTPMSTTTASDGSFHFTGIPDGEQYFEYNGSSAVPVGSYGAYRGRKTIIAHVDNVIERPIYIMKIDMAGATDVDPSAQTVVHNPNIGVTVTIPTNTVVDDSGALFDGRISVSPVPADFTPGSLPSTLDPGRVVTIQPMGLTFNQPAPISFPNEDHLAPGSEVNIWSMDHELGIFFIAGKGRVSDDGKMIETIDGGIRESSWHFPLPLPPWLGGPEDNNPNGVPPNRGPGDGAPNGKPADGPHNNEPEPCNQCPCPAPSSKLGVSDGCLESSFALPAYISLGESRQLAFSYLSERANPQPILPFVATLPQIAAVPDRMSYQLLSFGGIGQGGGSAIYWNTADLDPNKADPLRGALVGVTGARTGIYPYTIRLTNEYGGSKVSADINGRQLVVNAQDSPFGAGWELVGLQRLYPQADDSLLLVNGDGSALRFATGSFRFTDFADLSPFKLNGNAAVVNTPPVVLGDHTALRLTQGGNQVSSAFLTDPVPVVNEGQAVSFSTHFEFQINDATGSINGGADGLTFALVSAPNSLGAYGGYLGYSGIQPSLAVEFDTYDNFWDKGDSNHVGIDLNGDMTSVVMQHLANDMNRGDIWSAWVDYDAVMKRLEVRVSDTGARPAAATIFATVDLAAMFGASKVYAGFTSGTGSDYASHDIRLWEYTAAYQAGQNDYYLSPDGDFSSLARQADGAYIRRMKDGTQYRFNAAGLMTAMVDRNGNATTYTYDGGGRLMAVTDPVGLKTTLTYNNGRLAQVTDPTGRVTTFTHDAGNLVGVAFPDETQQAFGYDARHLMTAETDRRGFKRERTYDAYGRLVSATLPGAVERSATYAQKVGIAAVGQGTVDTPATIVSPDTALSTVTDGEGHTITYTIGALGNAASITDPAGFTTFIARDADANPVKTTLPSGHIWENAYDSQGNVLSTVDSVVQGTTTYAYDPAFSQVTSVTDPFANVTTFAYDTQGNLTQGRSPLGRTLRFAYDGRGLPTVMTDTVGTRTTFGYNDRGHLTGLSWGSGGAVRGATLTYTPQGYVETQTDPLGRLSRYTYDAFGRVISETLPGGRTVTYQYDGEGNLTALTPPGRAAHTFEYDGLGQVTAYVPPAVTGSGSTRTLYAYNKAQQLTTFTRPDGKTITYDYDTAGRPASVQFSRGTLTYAYSPATGQVSGVSDPGGVSLAYQYNGELLTSESWSGLVAGSVQFTYDAGYRTTGVSVNGTPITYQYDADSAPTQAGDLTLGYQPASGLITNTTLGTINDSFSYNSFGELQGYTANVNATPIFRTSYTRDALGRITGLTETIINTTTVYGYSYDAAGRLAQVTSTRSATASYTYDANGNRLSATNAIGTINGSYDDQDRLLSYGNNSYTYTANGELQTKTANGQQTTYSYDEFGNLTSVVLPGNTTITYLIDGQDRRIGKKVNGVLQKGWLYENQLRPVAELDGSGAVVSRFVYATRVNVPDYMVKAGKTYRLVLDHLGSVRLVVNTQNGGVVQLLDYDAWGVVTRDTNPGFQPFGFAGGLYDGQTGLVRFGARDYDAGVGQWTSKDPIGFAGGANLYAYAFNDPVNLVDSDGSFAVALVLNPYVFGALFFTAAALQVCILNPSACGQSFPSDSSNGDSDYKNGNAKSGAGGNGNGQCKPANSTSLNSDSQDGSGSWQDRFGGNRTNEAWRKHLNRPRKNNNNGDGGSTSGDGGSAPELEPGTVGVEGTPNTPLEKGPSR